MEHIDHRKTKRFKANTALAISPYGMCQMINLSKTGLSFKCNGAREFPDEWAMSIYDTKDLNLEELKVKKVWEKRASGQGITSQFEVVVGGKFKNLSAAQKNELYSYLLQIV